MNARGLTWVILIAVMGLAGPLRAADPAAAAEPASLVTSTPAEGFALAVKLSRLGVKTTQPDVKVLHELRPGYSTNANSLIAASQVVPGDVLHRDERNGAQPRGD